MTVLAFVIGIVVLVVGLALSIALHELGHLLPAKAFGVRVGQYMVGFGPTLFSRRKGETEYGVKAIPLGGYISMAGMYPPSPALGDRMPVGADADVPADAAATDGGRRAGRFFSVLVQDARTANDETLAGADDDRVFYKLPVWKRVVVMLGGPVMNLLLAIVLFTILLSGIGLQTATSTVASLSPCVPAATDPSVCADETTPAEAAGLEAGDEIVAIDGVAVDTFADASEIIRSSAGRQLEVVVRRDGDERTLRVTPVAVPAVVVDADGEEVETEVGFVGFRPDSEFVRQPLGSGAVAAVENVGAVSGIIWQLPVKVAQAGATLFTGEDRDPDGPLSVVGASVIAGEAAASDAPIINRVSFMIGLLGSLNIALFVFNLIPLLPLDGGHVVVALWDGAKRTVAKLFRRPPPKPVDATKLVPLTFVVVICLVAMGAVLILADLLNPISLF